MVAVNKIMTNVVDYGLKKPINFLTTNLYAQKSCKKFQEDKLGFIGGLAIASIVLKDGVGCYMYVKQSLSNKAIPEDKRKFVAALDMTNGGLMIASQILMYLTISSKKVQGALFNKMFKKTFSSKSMTAIAEKIKANAKFKDVDSKKFDETFSKFKKDVQGFFGIFTSLVASTILAKRVLVPFLATPMADKAKAMMDKNMKPDQPEQDTFKSEKD